MARIILKSRKTKSRTHKNKGSKRVATRKKK